MRKITSIYRFATSRLPEVGSVTVSWVERGREREGDCSQEGIAIWSHETISGTTLNHTLGRPRALEGKDDTYFKKELKMYGMIISSSAITLPVRLFWVWSGVV